ncbi:MAG TPA: signal peptidase I [Acholeplasmataceae bacterium]|jgi:signal peptidase|nr:signal peptidase I [Acholeplasmataceae bacterium]
MIKKILYVIFIIFLIFSVGTLGSKIFGFEYYVVISDSMHPKIPKYSLVYIDLNEDEINVGDIIAYRTSSIPVVHRVVDIDGNIYTTHGDANQEESVEKVFKDDIIGVMKFHIPYIGLLFLNRYLWIIVLLVIVSYIIIVRMIKEMKK